MRYVCFFVLLGLYGPLSFGQILNVNKHDIVSDSAKYWMTAGDFMFMVDNRSPDPSESASLVAIESEIGTQYVSELHVYTLISQLNYYRATGDPIISTGFLHARINFFRKRRFSYEMYTQALFDHSRFLDLRFLSGGGIKYDLLNKDKVEFDIGFGLFYEREKWRNLNDDGTFIIKEMLKSSSYFKANISLSETTEMTFVGFYQVGYDQEAEIFRQRVSVLVELEIAISKRLSFIFEGNIHYEDEPIIDINQMVYGMKNGLRYRL